MDVTYNANQSYIISGFIDQAPISFGIEYCSMYDDGANAPYTKVNMNMSSLMISIDKDILPYAQGYMGLPSNHLKLRTGLSTGISWDANYSYIWQDNTPNTLGLSPQPLSAKLSNTPFPLSIQTKLAYTIESMEIGFEIRKFFVKNIVCKVNDAPFDDPFVKWSYEPLTYMAHIAYRV